MTLSPSSASPAVNETVALTAFVTGSSNPTVSWSTTGGTITPTGAATATFTAPATSGTFIVTARSEASPESAGTCVISVSSIGISISPATASVGANGTLNFTATVTGAGNTAVTWTANRGTITSTSSTRALYTAPASTGFATVTATSVADVSRRATANLTITASTGNNARVNGRVVNSESSVGIAGVSVVFYNSGGLAVAQIVTGANGTFSATVPTTARRFHLDKTTIPTGFYGAFEFDAKRYSALIGSCSAPLPTLTSGANVTLATNIEVPPTSGPPPPPPNGCQ